MRIYILLIVVILLTSCGTERNLAYFRKGSSEFTLKVETTPCFGKCPVYELTIKESGLAFYNGIKFPETEGDVFKMLPKEEVDSLRKVFVQNDFFTLDSVYDHPGATDLPSMTISLTLGNGTEKTVRGRHETPEPFQNIAAFIERLRKRNFGES